jgi:anti-sigma B factor antagonist
MSVLARLRQAARRRHSQVVEGTATLVNAATVSTHLPTTGAHGARSSPEPGGGADRSQVSGTLRITTHTGLHGRIGLRLVGALDVPGAAILMEETNRRAPGPGDHVVVHLEDVTVLEPAGINALLYAEAFVRSCGGQLVISSSRPEVTARLMLAGLDRLLLGADKAPTGDQKPRSQAATIVERIDQRRLTMDDMIVPGPDGDGAANQLIEIIRRDTAEGVVVRVAGDIDLSSAPTFGAALEAAITANDKGLILDLGEVTFMDSSGVEVLVRARERAGERLHLRTMHRSVRRVLELASLLEWIAIDADNVDAPDDPHDRSAS